MPELILGGLALLFLARKRSHKRVLNVGQLVSHRETRSRNGLVIVEEVRFPNPVDCIKHYNQLVFDYAKAGTGPSLGGWTHNTFKCPNGCIELFRFGHHIRLQKTVIE